MTLRQALEQTISTLKTHLTVPVEAGKRRQFPTTAPAIWVFAEPDDLVALEAPPLIRTGRITVFAISQSSDTADAALDAVELCERAENVIINNLSFIRALRPTRFDAQYADFAVAYFEFTFHYDPVT